MHIELREIHTNQGEKATNKITIQHHLVNQTLKEMHIELREIHTNQGKKATK